MFPCPNCGKPIEVGPPPDVPWWRYDPGGTRVSLGCGTLILIAIIVAMFSRGGDDSREIRELQREIQTLERKIDAMKERMVIAPQPEVGNDQE